jgi:hypothetical protein
VAYDPSGRASRDGGNRVDRVDRVGGRVSPTVMGWLAEPEGATWARFFSRGLGAAGP